MTRRVVLADDHHLLLEGVKSLLQVLDSVEISAVASSGTELQAILEKQGADLVILDLNMPGMDGLQCLSLIKQHHPNTKVLVFTSYDQPELIREAKNLQADGYLIKNATAAEVRTAVTRLLDGKTYFPSQAGKEESGSSAFMDDFLKKFQLTKREVEIIRMICRELSSREIAATLFLSEFTVTTHRKNIFKKLGVKNVAGVINFAKENGLV